jgi:hypothetical protein
MATNNRESTPLLQPNPTSASPVNYKRVCALSTVCSLSLRLLLKREKHSNGGAKMETVWAAIRNGGGRNIKNRVFWGTLAQSLLPQPVPDIP